MAKKVTWKPDGYKVPTPPSKYMKLQLGANQFRIMSEPIMGWVYYNHDNKPVRVKEKEDIDLEDIGQPIKFEPGYSHFWAFVVWDYATAGLSILEITQSSIMNALDAHITEEDFADPTTYDIKVTKEVVAGKTTYKFLGLKEKPAPKEATEAYQNTIIHLDNMFHYLGDPYGPPLVDVADLKEEKF